MRFNINNENILSIDQIAECLEHASIELEGHYCESDNSRLQGRRPRRIHGIAPRFVRASSTVKHVQPLVRPSAASVSPCPPRAV